MAKKKKISVIEPVIEILDDLQIYDEIIPLGYSYADINMAAFEHWFITQKGLKIIIYYSLFHKKWFLNDYVTDVNKNVQINHKYPDKGYEDYDDALMVALNILLKTLKDK